MSLHVLANHMASKGRGGDSMLVHMTPGEVETLQKMAEKLGGTLTINPETGLPEANFLKKMLPMIAGLALAPLTAGTSLAFLGATPFATALTVGGITGLATGSLSKGLMAGLGAYGGASLGASFAGAGTNALTNAGLANYGDTLAARDLVAGTAEYGEAASKLALESQAAASQAPFMDKIGAGFGQVTSSGPAALDFAKANKGPLAAAGMSYMAGQEPAKLDIPTTTQSPAMIRPMNMTRERIMPGDPDYKTNEAGSQIGYFRTNYTVPEPYPAAANGGIVALADGGDLISQVSREQQYTRNPNQADQFANDAYLPAHGINLDTMQYYFPELNQGKNAQEEYNRAMAASNQPSASGAVFGGSPTADQGNAFTVGGGQQVNSQQLATDRMAQMAQAGQGVQWGSGQSEAGVIEQMRSQGWSPEYMAQAMGVPVDTISGAINRYDLGIGRERDLASRPASAVFGGSPTPTAAPSPFTVGGAQAAAPSGIETLSAQPAGQDLSGTVAGAFVGPRNTVITYDSTGKQTDTGRPASALNDYLTGAQESGTGSFVRSLSWGVSPEEDAKSALKLKDYARSKGLSESELLSQSGLENPAITATGLKSQFDKDLSGTAAGAFVGPNGTVITYDQYGKQTDTGRPASALNDYLTNPQESGVGAFVRGLSWGVSPEEDMKSSKKLYDYAKARGMNGSELIKQAGLEGSGITGQGLDAQWAQWNVQPIKPVDPYDPGSPIIKPPPGKAPLPAPNVPVNPPKPPGWTGITGTPIPPKPTPTGGIPTLTTLTGDPYGLTPTAEKFTPPTRTGRSKEIYDYLSGKTATAPASTRVRSEAKAPAPAPGTTESAAPKVPDPAQQPVINDIYGFIHTLGWGTPESDAISAPKLSAEAARRGWSIEQLSTASGFSVEAIRKMFDKYGVSTPPPAASPAPPPEQGGMAMGGMTRMAGGGLGSLGGYSDGGQLLRGPGDGVSDHIPATIGDKQPARLADGEFVVPARIVSELGNGSTEAGARSLYRMMDRVQAGRKKSIGKGKVAVNSRAEKYLPA